VRSVWFMYHEFFDGAAPPAVIPYTLVRYCFSMARFRRHLEVIRHSTLRTLTAAEWRAQRDSPAAEDSIVITFDDGWVRSLTDGVAALADFGFRGTFYVTRDFVGRPGCVTPAQLREDANAGMEIGAHGITHRYFSSLSEGTLRAELRDGRAFLEDHIGRPVKSLAAPGGVWTRRIAELAQDSGYETFATSKPGINTTRTDVMHLRRVGMRNTMDERTIARFCRYNLRKEAFRDGVLDVPKRLLGIERYARMRRDLLRALARGATSAD